MGLCYVENSPALRKREIVQRSLVEQKKTDKRHALRSYFQLSHRKEVRSNASRDCFIAARGDVEGKPNTHQKHKHTHTIVILTLLFVAVESFWFPQCVVQKSVRGSGAIGASRALAPPRLRKATSICLPHTHT